MQGKMVAPQISLFKKISLNFSGTERKNDLRAGGKENAFED
jgi:hypothetical protein